MDQQLFNQNKTIFYFLTFTKDLLTLQMEEKVDTVPLTTGEYLRALGLSSNTQNTQHLPLSQEIAEGSFSALSKFPLLSGRKI